MMDTNMYSAQLHALHRRHAWQPFTQMKLSPDATIIRTGSGAHLETIDGRILIDAIGSWWVNIHGHCNPHINRAVTEQLERLEHVIHAGYTHEKAILLAAALSETTGHKLPRVFYSDNGSTAVEIALKMAFQYFLNTGNQKKREFLVLDRGYHGDTIGAMSVGARTVFHIAFDSLMFPVHTAMAPEMPFPLIGSGEEADSIRPALDDLERLFENHGDHLCAMILEPLLQGAAGMRIYPASYLKRARELCDRHDVFLIADEVFTGMGRTGTMYACDSAGIRPDLMALSKGLSGGYFPFAATLTSERVFQGFFSDNREHTLFHGHSMTGNPSGCAAALASIELFEIENRLHDVKRLEGLHRNALQKIVTGPLSSLIREVRYLGSVGAIEFNVKEGYTGNFGWEFSGLAADAGVLLRPLGSVVYLTPPYTISDGDLENVYDVIEQTARSLLI